MIETKLITSKTIFRESSECLYGSFSIYNSVHFTQFLLAAVGGQARIIVASHNSEVAGIFRFLEKTVPGYGTVINSLPWFGSYGGAALAEGAPPETRPALIEKFYEYISGLDDLLSSAISLSPSEYQYIDMYASILRPTTVEERNCQLLKIPQKSDNFLEKILALMDNHHRRMARKSQKQGFVLKDADNDTGWEFLYRAHCNNMTAIGGLPKQKAHLEAIRAYIPSNFRSLIVAELEGQPVAALLCLFMGRTTEYIMPVIDVKFRSLQPLSFLIISQMQKAAERGCELWNFGGTLPQQSSLHYFKAGWGAIDAPYGYVINANVDRLKYLWKNGAIFEKFPFYYLFPKTAFSLKDTPHARKLHPHSRPNPG